MDGSKTFRVYNKCNFDIGITLTSGQQPIIRKGSFLPLSTNDILYIESVAAVRKPFSSRMLVAVGDDGKELKLEDLGGYTDTFVQKHYDDNEIKLKLQMPAKQVEKWLEKVEDPIELDGIIKIAEQMDLPNSKMRLLREKAPNSTTFES